MSGVTQLALDKIRIDGGTQSRAQLDEAVVAEYAQTIRDGSDFPPVVVFFDGKKHWLADGFHRFQAYRAAGAVELAADVRQGTRRDAILFSVGANACHGLRRSNDDKRRAVLTLLGDEEWRQWSDREIAHRCAVSREYVNRVRDTCDPITSIDRTFTHPKTGKPAKMATGNIGKKRPPAPDPADEAASQQVRDELPQAVKDIEAAKQQAAARRKLDKEQPTETDLSADQRIAELEETVRVLDAENIALKAENDRYRPMKVLFDQGGFEAVVAAKDEEIRVLKTRVERESGEKVSYLRARDYWKQQAERLGFNADVTIDMETGEVVSG